MTPAEKQQLKALFVMTAQYFEHVIPDEVLRLYVEDLSDLPFSKVALTMGQLRRDPAVKRCPLPSQIRSRLNPESNPESEALMIVGRITDAISRIGPYETARAREYLGPTGWEVVRLSGGWENVCELTTDTMATHKAQWRMLAKAVIERGIGAREGGAALEHKPSPSGMAKLGQIIQGMPINKEGA
jgi:hypothetical protein